MEQQWSICVAVESKTEPVTTDEAVKSELAEQSELVEPALAGADIVQSAIPDSSVVHLTLSSCEYVPVGMFQ